MPAPAFLSALNALLADHLVLVVKLHNYHWNVKGPAFRRIHVLTEGYYDFFFKSYDAVAERILQIGGTPLGTVAGALAAARIEEEAGTSFTEGEVLTKVKGDFEFLSATIIAALAGATESGDTITESLLLGLSEWLEKELWMLRSTLS